MTEIKSNADIEPCLSVVMPVFNEAATVLEAIKVVLAQRPVRQLIIVDDGSTDGTWEKLKSIANGEPRIELMQHSLNQGKGAALRDGFALATSPIVIIQDADLELAFRGKQHADHFFQHGHGFEFDGHGNLLQNFSPRNHPEN
jgi:glycosyltransferase involved in cell wall biosynthesis